MEMQSLPRVARNGGQIQQATGSGTWTDIFKFLKQHFMAIVTIIFCVSDVIMDGVNGGSFLLGDYYTKTIFNITLMPDNCTLMEKRVFYTEIPSTSVFHLTAIDTETRYIISCFEKDKMWGIVTIALMFAPAGLMFPVIGDMAELVYGPEFTEGQSICMYWLKFLLIPFYPLLLLATFICSLFVDTPRMKRWVLAAAQSEGTGEASLQLSVQLYIIFSLADRKPSYIQIFSLLTTIISASKSSIEAYLHDVNNALRKNDHQTTEENLLEEGKPLKEKLTVIAIHLPLFLMTTWFRVGTITVVTVLLKYWAGVYYGCLAFVIVVLWFITFFLPQFNSVKDGMTFVFTFLSNIIAMNRQNCFTREENKPFLWFNIWFYLILNTITIFILIILVEVGWPWMDYWDQLAFVQDKTIFFGVTGSVLACGILSCPLFYYQIYKKEEATASENPTVGNESQI